MMQLTEHNKSLLTESFVRALVEQHPHVAVELLLLGKVPNIQVLQPAPDSDSHLLATYEPPTRGDGEPDARLCLTFRHGAVKYSAFARRGAWNHEVLAVRIGLAS